MLPLPVSLRRILIGFACLAGLALNAWLWSPFFPYLFARGNNDFVCTYTGAALAGSGHLYDVDAVTRTQIPLGDRPQFMMYQRLPCYAALVSPLRFLSYRQAYWIWQCCSLGAVGVFIVFWPTPRRWMTAIACCRSIPLINCFIMGQDVTLVLAVLAISLAWLFRGRHFAAGLLLSLCSLKFHLFLTLPLLIVTKRLWRLGAGLLAGGAAMLAVSFAVEGWQWPFRYVHMLRLPTSTPSFSLMPNLNGLLSNHPHGALLTAAMAGLVLACAWWVMRRREVTEGLAAMLISGLLLSYHAFIADAILLLPAALILFQSKTDRASKLMGALLLSPLAFLAFRLQHPPYPPAAMVLLPLIVMAATATRRPIPATRQWWPPRHLPAAAQGRTWRHVGDG